jgi:phosphoribosylformylglycinamidine synthase|tara:strand:- start:1000 stop:1245 length:246 start_codon:yes stop_codon:yes gene_type:complete
LKISVIVTLKKEVLDPQGNTVQQTLKNMGYNNISQVRQGKFFEIEVDSDDVEKTKKEIVEICNNLLTNTVIEEYKITDSKN